MPSRRRRLDRELVARGLARDLPHAEQLIAGHRVLVDGAPALGGARLVDGASLLRLVGPPRPFVTRGGRKLAGALHDLGIAVAGRRCLDAGAGAGGFTDCLLQVGAAAVVAVDVGYGDFDWTLRNDPRVRLLERANVRTLEAGALGEPFDLVVADLSFISLLAVSSSLIAALAPDGDLVALVKPQFEAARSEVGPGGIVSDSSVWARVLTRVAAGLSDLGLGTAGVAASRLRGTEGNQEFFLWARRGAEPLDAARLQAALDAAHGEAPPPAMPGRAAG